MYCKSCPKFRNKIYERFQLIRDPEYPENLSARSLLVSWVCWLSLVQPGPACPPPSQFSGLCLPPGGRQDRTAHHCTGTAGYKRVDEVAKQALDSSGRAWGPSSERGIIIIYYFTVIERSDQGQGLRTSRVSARSACVVLCIMKLFHHGHHQSTLRLFTCPLL